MKRTFRFLTMGLLAVGLLASCNKKEDNNGGTADGLGFKAMTEQSGGNSRTHGVLQSDGTNEWLQVQWTQYDQIKVNNGSETRTFELTSGENSTSGEFYTSEGSTFDFTSGNFYAIYPAVNNADVENEVSDGTATFNLPATQTFSQAFSDEYPGSFGEKAMPMVAYSPDQTLHFKNVLGGICFPLVGEGYTVTRIELTSLADEALWGTCTTEINAEGYPTNTTVSNTASNKNVITLDCGTTGVTLSSTATEFTIMVPVGTLESGFTVTAYQDDNKIYEKSTSTAPGADFIPRNVIRVVNSDLTVVVSDLTVTTVSPTHITTNSALGIGTVSGGIPIECGVVYALSSALTDPTTDLVIGGTGVTSLSPTTSATSYDVEMTGLTTDMENNPIMYYVRAWAKNEVGTITYGEPIPFATRKNYKSSPYNGRLTGLFTVNSDGDKVYFSEGNLQYIGSAGDGQPSTQNAGAYFKFADNQWEMLGAANATYSMRADRDLFGWATSGWNNGNYLYEPYRYYNDASATYYTSTNGYGYGPKDGTNYLLNLTGNYANCDWGVYHSSTTTGHADVIQNASGHSWRTLQGNNVGDNKAEWYYLINSRSCAYRYAHVRLSDVNRTAAVNGRQIAGLVIFPDTFEWPLLVVKSGFRYNINSFFYAPTNQLTEAEWSLLEQQGVVFLPAAGYRDGTTYYEGEGYYWTTTYNASGSAYRMGFSSGNIDPSDSGFRYYGFAVRLVCPQ